MSKGTQSSQKQTLEMDKAEDYLLEKEEEIEEISDDEQSMKNPPNMFTTNGIWNEEKLNKVTAIIPPNERFADITSELYKKRKPNSRNWMAPIQFSFENYQSDIIRVEDVQIPYSLETEYGSKFVYIRLPESLRNLLKNSLNIGYPLNIDDNNLIGAGGWWKFVTSVQGKLGCVREGNMVFSSIPLRRYFDEHKKGLKANILIRFVCKASTNKTKDLDNSITRNLKVELLQGFVTSVDENVNQPFRRAPALPRPLSKDVTPEETRKRLAGFGLWKEWKSVQIPMVTPELKNSTAAA